MKTVFLNIFTISIGKVALPGGVLEQIVSRADPDTRIVFLTSEAFKDRFTPFVRGNVAVEYISFSKDLEKKNLIQKIFYFFYSFLIFTGTTKILATFGARADVPPAGGNRHMAPVKAAIAHTFGRSKFIKTKFVPWAYEKLHQRRPFSYLFEKYSPDLIFSTNIISIPEQEIIAEAKRRGVKTVGMAMNWDHLNKYYIPFHTDFFIAQNEPMKREAVDLHEYDESRVEVTGFPDFDMHINFKKKPHVERRILQVIQYSRE